MTRALLEQNFDCLGRLIFTTDPSHSGNLAAGAGSVGLGLLCRIVPSLEGRSGRRDLDSLIVTLRKGFESLVYDYRISVAELQETQRAYTILRIEAGLGPLPSSREEADPHAEEC